MPVVISMVVMARALWARACYHTSVTPYGNRLPKRTHAVLPSSSTKGRRVLIIGDVHGCARELDALLSELARPSDLVLVVGDLVNKGPDSARVLGMVRDLDIISVRGNHDDQALAAWREWSSGRPIPKYKKHAWVQGLEAGTAAVMLDLPFTLTLEAYNATLVHAGLIPRIPMERQALGDLFTMRDVVPADADDVGEASDKMYEEGLLAASAVGGTGRPWAEEWKGPRHLFFGHDAARRLQLEAYATGLDTGCVYGGQLTACVLPALDAEGKPVKDEQGLPSTLTQRAIRLHGGSGIQAHIVSLASAHVYSDKFLLLEHAAKVVDPESVQ